MLKIVYMGTPNFAVPALEMLIAHAAPGALLPDGYEIVTVITRPDKPAGRGRGVVFSPVKQAALAHNIPVWQPGSFKKAENSDALAAYHADLYVVAAFGQILPQKVLDQPRYGTINIHASLLPRYRGADPIAEAILQGDKEAGVSIMLLDAGVDTGPVLSRKTLPLKGDETTGTLTTSLSTLGAEALQEVLPQWISGVITPEPQNNELATHTRMLNKEDGEIQWTTPAAVLARKVRAYQPWPGLYSYWKGKMLKIQGARSLSMDLKDAVQPGTVSIRDESGHKVLAVATGAGLLLVKQLQLEGKKSLSTDEFLRGYAQINGDVLGK
ncbi:MAG TPA: methionyl-tRNA formyltransferase [Dictyobacter sp.]|nr:methionyl-tRNA formyltransferase [Dictyobacter sp.]